jgi:hypothetical protein
MSEVKVNKISPRTNCGTVQLGDSGDTITIPAGATITNNGTQTGFGRTGTVNWDTTAKTASFTAVSGNGYFVNTTSGAITVTMPASPSAGDIVSLSDYAGTWGTNNVNLSSAIYNGGSGTPALSTNSQTVTLIYVDGTKGWITTNSDTDRVSGFSPVVATGGTITCCGDYKIHTFTSPGTFCVSCAGAGTVDYMVIAGGGGGGMGDPTWNAGGGGGGGGYRESSGAASGCYSVSPLGACVSALPVTVQGYPITVGGGGAGASSYPSDQRGISGSNSIFSTITSTGGGGGGGQDWPGTYPKCSPLTEWTGKPGGSGGGGGQRDDSTPNKGSGNTPPVSPPQGNDGGNGYPAGPAHGGAGGGGATAVGGDNTTGSGGNGGAGATSSINGTPTGRAGGAGGAGVPGGGTGTDGGGNGKASNCATDTAGTANTGGGGGGSGGGTTGKAGGSGIVIIRYKYQ